MPRLTNAAPKYRKHRASGQAIVTLNGKDPGDTNELGSGSHTMRAKAEVRSIMPIESIELLFNNKLVATLETSGEVRTATLD